MVIRIIKDFIIVFMEKKFAIKKTDLRLESINVSSSALVGRLINQSINEAMENVHHTNDNNRRRRTQHSSFD